MIIPKDKMLQKALTNDETDKPQLCCQLCVDNLTTPENSNRPSLIGRPSINGTSNSSNKRLVMQRTESLKSNISSSPGNSGLNNFSAMESLMALSSQLTMTKLEQKSDSEKSVDTADSGAARPVSVNKSSQSVPSPLPSPLLSGRPISSDQHMVESLSTEHELKSEVYTEPHEELENLDQETNVALESESEPPAINTTDVSSELELRPSSYRTSAIIRPLVPSTPFAEPDYQEHVEPTLEPHSVFTEEKEEDNEVYESDEHITKAEESYDEFVRQLSVSGV